MPAEPVRPGPRKPQPEQPRQHQAPGISPRSPARPGAPPGAADGAEGRSRHRVQAKSAALPNAARATSLSGAPIPLETAGTSSATVPAHRARSPRLGRASAATFAAKARPSSHWTSRQATGPRSASADGVEHLGHQRIDRLVQVRLEHRRAPGPGRPWAPGGDSRARRRRSPGPGPSAASRPAPGPSGTSNSQARPVARRPGRGGQGPDRPDHPRLPAHDRPDRQQARRSAPGVSQPDLRQPEDPQRQHPQAERDRQRPGVGGMLRRRRGATPGAGSRAPAATIARRIRNPRSSGIRAPFGSIEPRPCHSSATQNCDS